MTYGHLQADCLYTGISSGPNARCRVWEAFTLPFTFIFWSWEPRPVCCNTQNAWKFLLMIPLPNIELVLRPIWLSVMLVVYEYNLQSCNVKYIPTFECQLSTLHCVPIEQQQQQQQPFYGQLFSSIVSQLKRCQISNTSKCNISKPLVMNPHTAAYHGRTFMHKSTEAMVHAD